jgi:hypothetical protein
VAKKKLGAAHNGIAMARGLWLNLVIATAVVSHKQLEQGTT